MRKIQSPDKLIKQWKCRGSHFLAPLELERLDSTIQVLVDSALVCSRLQIVKLEGMESEKMALVEELEAALYSACSNGSEVNSTKDRLLDNRVRMSVGEVKTFFGIIKALSPLSIICNNI